MFQIFEVPIRPSSHHHKSTITTTIFCYCWSFYFNYFRLTQTPFNLNIKKVNVETLPELWGFCCFETISDLGFWSSFIKMVTFRSMDEFWLFYMNQHSKPATRRWHFAGTLSSILCLIYAVLFNWWFLFFVPLLGYGMAWYSHFYVEGNIPATFGHPIWSFLCDYKMFGLMITGQMDREIKRLGKRPVLYWFLLFPFRNLELIFHIISYHIIYTCNNT